MKFIVKTWNWLLAIDTYISYVDKSTCGSTVIHLYKGAENSQYNYRERLKTLLKGSKLSKEKLQRNHPSLYSQFENIWNIRCRHMVTGYPQQCHFLLACFDAACPHPFCQKNSELCRSDFTWFRNGLLLSKLPVPDNGSHIVVVGV